MKKKAAVVGLGNTGKYTVRALQQSTDFECVGIIRREAAGDFEGVKQYAGLEQLPVKPDVVILCVPSKIMPETAKFYLERGISVADSFDIHDQIADAVEMLDPVAKSNNAACVVSAGWDPGSDSMIRTIFTALNPRAKIYTSFGPGMSMGHSVVARGVKGVADAVSITLPLGMGKHKRHVYVVLDGTQTKEQVYTNMKADKYFAHDELEVEVVEDIAPYKNANHGGMVEMEEGDTKAKFVMTVNNPQTTAYVMVACARAALRMPPGAYTVIDLPLVTLLEGDRIENIKKLV
ncbi:diaminopimelate dehydrogenase [Elusimicrobium simillimum]|uniref:diaminopimelate dehydrogenase n=1 Tax=Elusimicrobium simillimum TaxID=3143438 RepID=UPI003C704FB5